MTNNSILMDFVFILDSKEIMSEGLPNIVPWACMDNGRACVRSYISTNPIGTLGNMHPMGILRNGELRSYWVVPYYPFLQHKSFNSRYQITHPTPSFPHLHTYNVFLLLNPKALAFIFHELWIISEHGRWLRLTTLMITTKEEFAQNFLHKIKYLLLNMIWKYAWLSKLLLLMNKGSGYNVSLLIDCGPILSQLYQTCYT